MKKNLRYTSTVFLVLAFGALFLSGNSHGSPSEGFSRLILEIQADKGNYLLGELIGLDFRATNRGYAPVFLYRGSDVWEGHVEVLIAYGDEDYKQYRGPGWGLKDVRGTGSIKLRSGDVFKTNATVLYNHPSKTSRVSEPRAKEVTPKYAEDVQGTRSIKRGPGDGWALYNHPSKTSRVSETGAKEIAPEIGPKYIETEYALGKPGTYHLKAILYDAEFANKIESEPIEITVTEPEGLDGEVWNELKSDAEYGYFIQTGGFQGDPTSAKTKQMVETLERIVYLYPASSYAESIRAGLSEHRSLLEKVKKLGVSER